MKRLLLLVILACVSWSSVPQTTSKTLDSLTILLGRTQDPIVKIPLIEKIASAYALQDLTKALEYTRKGVRISDKLKSAKWQPVFYEMHGRNFANSLQLDSASFYFNKAEKGYKAINNKRGQATTFFKIAWVHKKRGDLQSALEADLAALKMMEALDDKEGIAGANERLSEDVLRQGRKEDALNYAKKSIEISEKNGLSQQLVYSKTAAGAATIAMGNAQEAYTYFSEALNEAENLGFDPMSLSDFYNNRGNALKRLNKYDDALADYKKVEALATQANYTNAINTVSANLGEINLLLGNYEAALPYQLKTVQLQEESGDLPNLPENYMHISTIYEKLGDYKTALAYQKKSRIMKDSISAVQSDKAMSELLTQYQTEKKEQTISAQTEKITAQKKAKTLYIILAALLGVILFGMFFTLRNISKKRKALSILNIQLDAKNQQNELLLKEIHHRVKNNLEMVKSLIALQSAQLTDEASKDAMLASQNRVQSMGIIHQKLYQGDTLGSIEMKDYFINLGEGVLDTFDADDKVKIECAMDVLNLDVDTAVPVGLIVNELLTNALKYAFPEGTHGKINISLKTESNDLQLKVTDNGIGKTIGAQPKGTGFGTQLIQLLTQQLNGTIQENYDNGTEILFNFKNFRAA